MKILGTDSWALTEKFLRLIRKRSLTVTWSEEFCERDIRLSTPYTSRALTGNPYLPISYLFPELPPAPRPPISISSVLLQLTTRLVSHGSSGLDVANFSFRQQDHPDTCDAGIWSSRYHLHGE